MDIIYATEQYITVTEEEFNSQEAAWGVNYSELSGAGYFSSYTLNKKILKRCWEYSKCFTEREGRIMKKAVTILAATAFSILCSNIVFAGQWQPDEKGWRYLDEDNAIVISQWIMDEQKWYYVGSDGYMTVNTWIGNYYVGSDGAMLVNTTTPDGYMVGTDGAWISDQVNHPTASYAAFMRDKNMYMYGYWKSPDSGYGAIQGEVSDVVDCGDYYELKGQVLTQAKQYNTEEEAKAEADSVWDEIPVQLPNGKYCLCGDSMYIASEIVYQGSIYINKDVIFEYDTSNGTIYTTFDDYLARIEEISKHGNGDKIGARITGIDEKGYVTHLVYAVNYFW